MNTFDFVAYIGHLDTETKIILLLCLIGLLCWGAFCSLVEKNNP